MIDIKQVSMINCQDWDNLVTQTYGRIYNFQQQDDCKPRGVHHMTVPDEFEDEYPDTVPEIVNGDEMGVSFAAWLARDPKQLARDPKQSIPKKQNLRLWWERNFYPTWFKR
jgi:hypothetical protein